MADHHARDAQAARNCGLDREARVVDRAERRARDDPERQREALREVGHRELFGRGHQQASRALHHEERAARAQARVGGVDRAEVHAAALGARGGERRGRQRETHRAHVVERVSFAGRAPQRDRVGGTARADAGLDRLHRRHRDPACAQRTHERAGDHGLADARVGAGHEHAALHRLLSGARATSSATASASASISSSPCVAIGVRRSRAVPSGTDGWRIPCA